MPFEEPNSENKQHIRLSQKAQYIIEDDMNSFQIKSTSGFFNTLITNFYQTADASISLSVPQRIDAYRSMLSGLDEPTWKKVRKNLETALIKNLTAKSNSYKNDITYKFRINNKNLEYFTEDCTENKYYSTLGKYIKALVEEYCEKSYPEREQIIYADFFHNIDVAIKTKKRLKIKLMNSESIHVKPYSIETDPLSMYHYLTGYSIDRDTGKETSFSYRITNLKDVKCLQASSFISAEKQALLDKKIHENGSQFLREAAVEIKVFLTDVGIQKYNRLLHLRPRFCSADDHVYTFRCTEQQIEFYFFKFGAEATIISPAPLRDKFKAMHEEALKNYR